MRIGLYFGSFNPVHTGHMVIANYMVSMTDLNEVWMVVSPQNPLKKKASLANDYQRLNLVQLAIGDTDGLRTSSIEFKLPQPSYTIDTLAHLREQYPQHQFVLIMGGDNLQGFSKWKNHEIILRDYEIYVYKRPEYTPDEFADHPHVRLFTDVPVMDISATYIRERLSNGQSVRYLVPEAVYVELMKSGLYQK